MTESEKLTALRLARNAIESELLRTPLARLDQLPPLFAEEGAVFVTLKNRDGSLRGCIGSLLAHRSLYEDIVENSISSAFKDPRFMPLSVSELPNIKIELSLLKTPVELAYDSADELLSKITPMEDGVIIKFEEYQATFLPSVWEEIPQKRSLSQGYAKKPDLTPTFGEAENSRYTYTKPKKLAKTKFLPVYFGYFPPFKLSTFFV